MFFKQCFDQKASTQPSGIFVKYSQAAILLPFESFELCTFGEFVTPADQLYSPPNYRNPLSEHELIRGCLRGSAQCQRDLYERFAGKMYAVCLRYARNREDAADILQEGFLKVFTKLGQFQFQGSFEGWIRRVMVNTALRAYQKQRYDFEQSGYEHLPETPVDPDAVAMLSEAELLNLVRQLPDGYRAVFNLVAIEGFSHAEAAKLLGIQESTSRSQLTKARRHLEAEVAKLERVLI